MTHIRLKPTLFMTAIFFLLSGCGEAHHASERYVRDVKNEKSDYAKKIGDTHIQQIIYGTRTVSGSSFLSVFTDTYSRDSAPYTLAISAGYYGEMPNPLVVLDVTMSIDGDAPLDLLNHPVSVSFGPWLDHAESAKLEIELAGKLTFREGREVVVTTTFVPPDSTTKETITTVFKGIEQTTTTSKLKMLLKG